MFNVHSRSNCLRQFEQIIWEEPAELSALGRFFTMDMSMEVNLIIAMVTFGFE